MTRHRRSFWSKASRELYLASRAAGDVQAVKRGRLQQRLARRYERRLVWRLLRKLGL